MWTVFVLLNLWGLHCSVSSTPPSPTDVRFSSVNLRNVLHWLPGNGTLDNTHFTVEYAIYGDNIESSKGRRVNWRAVQKCTKIVRTWCDLSNETWDEEQSYHARVRAVGRRRSSKWGWTQRRFDPMLDTIFGPPLISVETENNNAIITLKGPMRYSPNNHTPGISMAALYPQMSYNLSIHNTHHDQMVHLPVVTSPYKYNLMEYSTKFCFSAQSKFISMPIHCQSSAWHCIITPQDPVVEQLKKAVVGIVVPSFCICMFVVIGYILYHYLTGNGQKSPGNLQNLPPFHPSPLPLPPEKVNLIPISIITAVMDSPCSNCHLHIADPPPIYSQERPETPTEPEEPWDDSSIDYGKVVVAPSSNGGEKEASEGTHDKGNNGSNVKGAALDSREKEDLKPEDGHSAGVYAPQARSCFSSVHQFRQTHTPICEEIEMSTHGLLHAWPCKNSVSQAQTQASFHSFQQPTIGEVSAERDAREHERLFISNNSQMYRLKEEVGKVKEMDGEVRVRIERKRMIDGGVEEGSECENVALLSAYVSQNHKNMPTSHSDQSDFLSDDYGILAATEQTEKDFNGDYDYYYDEDTVCIKWDPETRKLELPEIEMKLQQQGGLDGLSKGGREDGAGKVDEEDYVKKGVLKLENVFVRQTSEEETEVRSMLERGEGGGWKVEDGLTKWDLVVSMDL